MQVRLRKERNERAREKDKIRKEKEKEKREKDKIRKEEEKAERGDAEAQYNLGAIYASGDVVHPDNVMAHMYWNISAVSGHTGAIKNRGDVEKKMTSSEIEKAQDLAREWVLTHQ